MNPSNPSIHTAQVLPARAVLFLGIIGLHVVMAFLEKKRIENFESLGEVSRHCLILFVMICLTC